ncbi:uncharacterized protein F5891DRAFT_1197343 [Suillus fuscotomentosus]|uniref:F-box domain-containing protein n=1 Tax=Suillus fuscotomentosus TaxID=1912939 RepID=A0AAD4DRW9_9AGAM|nr:uncharacterized protein F5891DRAFT_1197343 [Suillus fuscotomentosus]KAG1891832.1 hypothetical protein F5891DRAFT_1197343 [Suillus fuscotomentosus]
MLHLPHEIERAIFQVAAGVHPTNHLPSYLLVAERVRQWIEEVMYHTIVFTSEAQACRFVESRPVASAKVKSLCLGSTLHLVTAADVMELCSHVDSLALWIVREGDAPGVPACLLNAFNRLPKLSQLSIRVSTVFCRNAVPFLPSMPIFNKITHLELLEGWVLWGFPIGIHYLTRLTHLSLRVVAHQTAPASLRIILMNCVCLELLVLRVIEGLGEVGDIEKWLEDEGLADPRIVVTTMTPYHSWVNDDRSLWQYGDYILKDRTRTS